MQVLVDEGIRSLDDSMVEPVVASARGRAESAGEDLDHGQVLEHIDRDIPEEGDWDPVEVNQIGK